MGLRNYRAAVNAAVFSAIALAAGATAGKADDVVPCPKPIAHCAREVGAWCEKESNGKIVLIYRDKSFYSAVFHECIGKVYEQHGRPNPYRPSQQQKSGQTQQQKSGR